MTNDPAAAARAALFGDDFYIDDPREPSPTAAEPLLRRAIAADPSDATSTLLLASVLARQLDNMYFETDPAGMLWTDDIVDEGLDPDTDEDFDTEEEIERLWHEAVLARENEIGRLLAPLAGTGAAAALLTVVLDAAEAWREDNRPDLAPAGDLEAARRRSPDPVDPTARRYDWYQLELATMVDNYGDISTDTWLATDTADLRTALERRFGIRHSPTVWHDEPNEGLWLSRYHQGECVEVIDLKPHLRISPDAPPRMDWDGAPAPAALAIPLPVGHPVFGVVPRLSAIHYGSNPGLV